MAKRMLCPVCMHSETVKARCNDREAVHEDPALMQWIPPGPGYGRWNCGHCGLLLSARAGWILLDAVLMCADPDCDSIEEGLHRDTIEAMELDALPTPETEGGE